MPGKEYSVLSLQYPERVHPMRPLILIDSRGEFIQSIETQKQGGQRQRECNPPCCQQEVDPFVRSRPRAISCTLC